MLVGEAEEEEVAWEVGALGAEAAEIVAVEGRPAVGREMVVGETVEHRRWQC